MSKYYRIVCRSKLEDMQLETLRDNQINIGSVSSPVGIESFLKNQCEVYEVHEDGDRKVEKRIGFIRGKMGVDEGEFIAEYEVSESMFNLAKRFLI